jgi:transposase
MLVHQRTALMLSFKSLYTRTTGQELTLSKLKELEIKAAQELYEHPANQMIAGMQIKHIEQLTESIEKIEKAVLGSARELPYYEKLATLPGVGRLLGMTITMEVGDIKRFAAPRLWKRPTLRGATMSSAGSGLIARRPRRATSSRSRRSPASWPKRPGI